MGREWGTWQSPITAWIWFPFYRAFGIYGVLSFQMVTSVLASFCLIRKFIKNERLQLITLAAISLHPLILGFNIMLTKEGLMYNIYLVAFVFFFRRKTWIDGSLFFVFIFIAACIRYEMSIVSLFIFIYYMITFGSTNKRRIVFTCLGGLSFILIPFASSIKLFPKASYPIQQIFQLDLNQMSALSNNDFSKDNVFETSSLLSSFLKENPGDIITYNVQSDYGDKLTIKTQYRMQALFLHWVQVVLDHPFLYLKNRWVTTLRLFQCPGQNDCFNFTQGVSENSLGFKTPKSAIYMFFVEYLNDAINYLFFRPWFIFLLGNLFGFIYVLNCSKSFWMMAPLFFFSNFSFLVAAFTTTTCALRMISTPLSIMSFAIAIWLSLFIEKKINH